MFVVVFLQIDEMEFMGKVDFKVEVFIMVCWFDGYLDDVDVVVEDLWGEIVWYQNQDVGLFYFDCDDCGMLLDIFEIDGECVLNLLNQESVFVCIFVLGEYVVNFLYYKVDIEVLVLVIVKVEDFNFQVFVVYYGEYELC